MGVVSQLSLSRKAKRRVVEILAENGQTVFTARISRPFSEENLSGEDFRILSGMFCQHELPVSSLKSVLTLSAVLESIGRPRMAAEMLERALAQRAPDYDWEDTEATDREVVVLRRALVRLWAVTGTPSYVGPAWVKGIPMGEYSHEDPEVSFTGRLSRDGLELSFERNSRWDETLFITASDGKSVRILSGVERTLRRVKLGFARGIRDGETVTLSFWRKSGCASALAVPRLRLTRSFVARTVLSRGSSDQRKCRELRREVFDATDVLDPVRWELVYLGALLAWAESEGVVLGRLQARAWVKYLNAAMEAAKSGCPDRRKLDLLFDRAHWLTVEEGIFTPLFGPSTDIALLKKWG